jgi:hypothetical protein
LFAIYRERGKQTISEHRRAENTIELSSNVPKEDSIQGGGFVKRRSEKYQGGTHLASSKERDLIFRLVLN